MSDVPAISDAVPGWPSVVDLESQPIADGLPPQIPALTPRGPARVTDEAGGGKGASAVQRTSRRAVAAFAADHLGLDWTAATQTFPPVIAYTPPDWEGAHGLPGPCTSDETGVPRRRAAVRARFGSVGGQSPRSFASLGYVITIEEPTRFLCDVSACVGDDIQETYFLCDHDALGEDGSPVEDLILPTDAAVGDQVSDETIRKRWIIRVVTPGETWFRVDEGECADDPIEGFVPAVDLECAIRVLCPPHTVLAFTYNLAGPDPWSLTMDRIAGVMDSSRSFS